MGSKPEEMISKMGKGQKRVFLSKIYENREVGIVESVFNKEELILINQYFYEKVMQRLETESAELLAEHQSQ